MDEMVKIYKTLIEKINVLSFAAKLFDVSVSDIFSRAR
jgi:hypothetical protein